MARKRLTRRQLVGALREQLLEERRRIIEEMNCSDIPLIYGGEIADMALDHTVSDAYWGEREKKGDRLRMIDGALGSIEEGTYGVCGLCDKKIPLARLEAMPSAAYCVPCQAAIEGNETPPEDRGGSIKDTPDYWHDAEAAVGSFRGRKVT